MTHDAPRLLACGDTAFTIEFGDRIDPALFEACFRGWALSLRPDAADLIALDGKGAMLAESTISVQAPQASIITVQRGLDRESYSCTPNCQPSVQLGDAAKYFDDTSKQAEARRTMATQNR